ncbi:mobilization protein [Bacteroidia bacterium]|nr:mobilization protein [Bacteroidia bacterium]GHT61608.1 mobilization protein [Bacteroidia bacterium]
MVVRILQKSTTFAAIDYSEKKVMKNMAEWVKSSNFGYLDILGEKGIDKNKAYFNQWAEKNKRVENQQFHVSISCKGREYSKEQLVSIGENWLAGMGYAGLPTMIYFHTDTDNNHIHIITTRIGVDGKKINDSNEKFRAVSVMNQIMGNDLSANCRKDFAAALNYRYSNFNQFEAIINSMGYTTKIEDNNLNVYKTGTLLLSKSEELIHWRGERNMKLPEDVQRKKQIKALFHKYKDSMDVDKFTNLMKQKFGFDLIFFGKKDSPYGYTIVDHSKKNVFKGSEIMNIKTLLSGQRDKTKELQSIINASLEANKFSSTYELNKELLRHGAYIQQGNVILKKTKSTLFKVAPEILQQLKYSNKLETIQKFNITSIETAKVLGEFYQVTPKDIRINSNTNQYFDLYKFRIKDAFETRGYQAFYDLDLNFVKGEQNKKYIIDTKNQLIFSFDDIGIKDEDKIEYTKLKENEVDKNESDIIDTIINNFLVPEKNMDNGGGVNNELPKKKRKK